MREWDGTLPSTHIEANVSAWSIVNYCDHRMQLFNYIVIARSPGFGSLYNAYTKELNEQRRYDIWWSKTKTGLPIIRRIWVGSIYTICLFLVLGCRWTPAAIICNDVTHGEDAYLRNVKIKTWTKSDYDNLVFEFDFILQLDKWSSSFFLVEYSFAHIVGQKIIMYD